MAPECRNNVETQDVIILDCDDDERTVQELNLSNYSLRRKRDVTLSQVDYLETLCITQYVRTKKDKVKCAVKLKSDVEHKCCKKSCDSVKRFKPKCRRSKCNALIDISHNKHQNTKKQKSHKKRTEPTKHRSSSKLYKKKCKKDKKKDSKKSDASVSLSLSPISLSPFVSDISYEDISLDSFSSCSDGELDTLIRRSKDRERRICVTPEVSFDKPLHESSPKDVIELSSDDETTKHDVSLHSIETFVLESQFNPLELVGMSYSPKGNTDIASMGFESQLQDMSYSSTDNILSGIIEEYKLFM